jgi:serine/threonine-protein kinase
LISARDFERAAVMAAAPGRIVGQWHDYPSSLLIGWTYRLEGRGGDAAEEFEAARLELEADLVERPDDARLHVALGIAYAGLGRHREAMASGLKAVRLMPIAKDTFVGTWLLQDLGWIYVMVGEYDEAVDIFNRILEVPSIWSIELLRSDPRSEPLHDHPGFKHLIDKYGRA